MSFKFKSSELAASKYVLSQVNPSDYLEMAPDQLAIKIYLAGIAWGRGEMKEIAADACENIYGGNIYAAGDWLTPEQCAEAIRSLSDETGDQE